jgi:hypothetical protein
MTYAEKLKDPRWQKKRLEIFERDGWACMACSSKSKTLHVHHIFYLPKKEPWEIPNGFLITFCEGCHKSTGCVGQNCEVCRLTGFNEDCEGPGNHSEDIQTCIATLLNAIWEDDGIGDYFTALGFAHSRVK